MVEVRVHRCQFCAAPLEVSGESERFVRCGYCGRQNELRRAEAPAEVAPPTPTKRTPWVAVAVIGLVALVGAAALSTKDSGRRQTRPPAIDGPFSLSWADDAKLVVDGNDEVHARVALYEGHYQITFHRFPVGTRWTVGQRSGQLDSDIFSTVRLVSIEDELGSVPVARYRTHTVGPTDTLEVQIPSGDRASIALRPLSVGFTVARTLEGIENGPVRFDPEPERGARNSVALLETSGFKVFGPAETVRDIDQLAVVRRRPEVVGEKHCGGEDARGRPLPNVTLQLKETEVVVFDRRTGEVAESRVFPPQDRCPTIALPSSREGPRDSYPPTRDIEAWLGTLVRR